MLRIRLDEKKKRIVVNPTIFPDGTSQVWKLERFEEIIKAKDITIEWIVYHGETNIEPECMWLFQLIHLLRSAIYRKNELNFMKLKISYYPYARQDKAMSNDNTFGLRVFNNILDNISGFAVKIIGLDVHFDTTTILYPKIENVIPLHDIKEDIILFPDKGAADRYQYKYFDVYGRNKPSFVCEKERNQGDGSIIGIHFPPVYFKDKNIAIVDDICDGGMTFLGIAKHLKDDGAKRVKLYVTHGIFSKGKQVLYDAGIDEIETYDYERFFNDV